MEIIKKQIYLDPYISRHGSFIPYIVKDVEKQTPLTMGYSYIDVTTFSENGNWGCYPYDIDIKRCKKFISYNLIEITPSEDKDEEDIKNFFASNRVSFKELADKFSLLRKIVSDTKFYKTISKNGNIVWVEIDLSLTEKLNYEILDEFPAVYVEGYICGVYADNSFKENGGKKMFLFLMKAMGIFVVNPLYITDDNGIPETMYYASIGSYLKKMDKLKKSEKCCVMHDYEFWGGDLFYNYLSSKQSEIKDEINYWFAALYRENNEIPSPNLHMSVGLNEECLNIGNYIAVPDTDNGIKLESNNRYFVRALEKESQLKTLRRTKISYYDKYNMENGKWETEEFPLILDEKNDEEEKYELTQPYVVGYPKNLQQISTGNTYYGDMIYQMDYLSDGYVYIYYVIGGKLKNENGKWEYVDKGSSSNSTINVVEFIKNPNIFNGDIDDYMFIKEKLNDIVVDPTKYKNDGIFYKGELTEYGTEKYPDRGVGETWLYKVNFRYDKTKVEENKIKSDESYYIGDFIIVNDKLLCYHFNMQQIKDKNFSGVRYYEKKEWEKKNFLLDSGIKIDMLFNDKKTAVNILDDSNIIKNLENVELVKYTNMDDNVEGYFISNETLDRTYSSNLLLMNDYDFGKMEMIVENSADVVIDRGYVSTFELHYKLSEINTMEDMENYGNNFFGL